MTEYDVAIIGAGPGGYVAAIKAAQLKKKVILIEKDKLGGICLNWGCIPTKALLHVAKHYNFIKNEANEIGIEFDNLSFDFDKVIKFSRNSANKLASGISILMNKYKNFITIINETAKIDKNKDIIIVSDKNNSKKIKAKNIIIATGSRPNTLTGFEDKNIWYYRDALNPDKLPKKLAIIGSGAIGIEFSNFYNSMGSEVHVIEMQSNILPNEDEEISNIATKSFIKKGIKIYTNSKSNIVNYDKDIFELEIINDNKKINLKVDKILIATGVNGNISNIGIENFSNIKIVKNFLKVDKNYCTGEKNIFAIGDVIGVPCLAHKAMHNAIECIEKIFNCYNELPNKSLIPNCTYSDPQIASIGITEKEARNRKIDFKIGRFNATGNGKSVILNNNEGMIKVIIDKKTNAILGAHMIGEEVTEMIQGFNIAHYLEGNTDWLKKIIFAHPTISEMMHEALLDSENEALHK